MKTYSKKMIKKTLLSLMLLIISISAYSDVREVVLLTDLHVRVGDASIPATLRSTGKSCYYWGEASSNSLGIISLDLVREKCLDSNLERTININLNLQSAIKENTNTNEKINFLASGNNYQLNPKP